MFWNNVESKPWGAYPLAWDVRILEKLGEQEWKQNSSYKGKTVFEAAPPTERVLHFNPQDEDWMYPNIGEDDCSGLVNEGKHIRGSHENWFFYLPRTCAHCTYPACLSACPRKAIYKREEDGVVLIDESRCKGYGECVRACPYKKSMYNPYTRVSEKCIGCFPAVEKGEQPMCVQNCIGKIRIMGFISLPWKSRKNNPVDFLVHEKKLALPLYPQLGLEPNIYYIPPVHVAEEYLTQMFGPQAGLAVKNYHKIKDDPEIQGLLVLMGSTPKIIHSFEVTQGVAIAYNESNEEIVRVPVKEPLIERPAWDPNQGVVRTNTP
jgi:nitrate reductase beta subunit